MIQKCCLKRKLKIISKAKRSFRERERKECMNWKLWLTTRTQCLLDTTVQLILRKHRGWGIRHKTCARTPQTKIVGWRGELDTQSHSQS